MLDSLKPLLESGLINEDIERQLNEAWEAKLHEAKEHVRAELRSLGCCAESACCNGRGACTTCSDCGKGCRGQREGSGGQGARRVRKAPSEDS